MDQRRKLVCHRHATKKATRKHIRLLRQQMLMSKRFHELKGIVLKLMDNGQPIDRRCYFQNYYKIIHNVIKVNYLENKFEAIDYEKAIAPPSNTILNSELDCESTIEKKCDDAGKYECENLLNLRENLKNVLGFTPQKAFNVTEIADWRHKNYSISFILKGSNCSRLFGFPCFKSCCDSSKESTTKLIHCLEYVEYTFPKTKIDLLEISHTPISSVSNWYTTNSSIVNLDVETSTVQASCKTVADLLRTQALNTLKKNSKNISLITQVRIFENQTLNLLQMNEWVHVKRKLLLSKLPKSYSFWSKIIEQEFSSIIQIQSKYDRLRIHGTNVINDNISKSTNLIHLSKTKPICFKPGPLSKKKHLLIDSKTGNEWDYEIVPIPQLKIITRPEIGKELSPMAIKYINLSHSQSNVIDYNWAQFALSTLRMENINVQSNEYSFVIPFVNNEAQILVKKHKQPEFNFDNTRNVDKYDVKMLVNDLIEYVERKEFFGVNLEHFSYDPDDLQQNTANTRNADGTLVKKADNYLNVIRRPRTNKQLSELKRLNVKIIEVATLDQFGSNSSEDQSFQKICSNDSCRYGCVCSSLNYGYDCLTSEKSHCRKVDCMFKCHCGFTPVDKHKSKNMMLLPSGTDIMSNETMRRLQKKVQQNLAKEEKKFSQTVIQSQDKTIIIEDLQKKRVRKAALNCKMNFANGWINDVFKGKDVTDKKKTKMDPVILNYFQTDFNLKMKQKMSFEKDKIMIYCMLHDMYDCPCNNNLNVQVKGDNPMNLNPNMNNNNDTNNSIKSNKSDVTTINSQYSPVFGGPSTSKSSTITKRSPKNIKNTNSKTLNKEIVEIIDMISDNDEDNLKSNEVISKNNDELDLMTTGKRKISQCDNNRIHQDDFKRVCWSNSEDKLVICDKPEMLVSPFKIVPPLQSEDLPPPQLEDLPPPQLEDLPPLQLEDLPPPQLEDLPLPQLEDLPPPQLEDLPPPQSKDLPSPQSKDLPSPQSKDLPSSQSEDSPPSQSEVLPPLSKSVDSTSTPAHVLVEKPIPLSITTEKSVTLDEPDMTKPMGISIRHSTLNRPISIKSHPMNNISPEQSMISRTISISLPTPPPPPLLQSGKLRNMYTVSFSNQTSTIDIEQNTDKNNTDKNNTGKNNTDKNNTDKNDTDKKVENNIDQNVEQNIEKDIEHDIDQNVEEDIEQDVEKNSLPKLISKSAINDEFNRNYNFNSIRTIVDDETIAKYGLPFFDSQWRCVFLQCKFHCVFIRTYNLAAYYEDLRHIAYSAFIKKHIIPIGLKSFDSQDEKLGIYAVPNYKDRVFFGPFALSDVIQMQVINERSQVSNDVNFLRITKDSILKQLNLPVPKILNTSPPPLIPVQVNYLSENHCMSKLTKLPSPVSIPPSFKNGPPNLPKKRGPPKGKYVKKGNKLVKRDEVTDTVNVNGNNLNNSNHKNLKRSMPVEFTYDEVGMANASIPIRTYQRNINVNQSNNCPNKNSNDNNLIAFLCDDSQPLKLIPVKQNTNLLKSINIMEEKIVQNNVTNPPRNIVENVNSNRKLVFNTIDWKQVKIVQNQKLRVDNTKTTSSFNVVSLKNANVDNSIHNIFNKPQQMQKKDQRILPKILPLEKRQLENQQVSEQIQELVLESDQEKEFERGPEEKQEQSRSQLRVVGSQLDQKQSQEQIRFQLEKMATKKWFVLKHHEIGYFEFYEIKQNGEKNFYLENPLTKTELMLFMNVGNVARFIYDLLKTNVHFRPSKLKLNFRLISDASEIRNMKPFDLSILGYNRVLTSTGLYNISDLSDEMLATMGFKKTAINRRIQKSNMIEENEQRNEISEPSCSTSQNVPKVMPAKKVVKPLEKNVMKLNLNSNNVLNTNEKPISVTTTITSTVNTTNWMNSDIKFKLIKQPSKKFFINSNMIKSISPNVSRAISDSNNTGPKRVTMILKKKNTVNHDRIINDNGNE